VGPASRWFRSKRVITVAGGARAAEREDAFDLARDQVNFETAQDIGDCEASDLGLRERVLEALGHGEEGRAPRDYVIALIICA
jgi:hypothetical protein